MGVVITVGIPLKETKNAVKATRKASAVFACEQVGIVTGAG